jgi:threonine dehydrogenase-like Zn-dependent dehydrogenase
MKALRFNGSELKVDDIPRPGGDGESVVRVLMSGICNTDIEISRGYAGFTGTLGHEFVGIVETSPDPAMIGKRVVGEINAGCGTCDLCLAGDPRHCPGRTVLGIVGRDGAHAEFVRLPTVNLVEVPDNVDDRSAVFVEPLAAAYGITERAAISAGDKVAVIGDGKLGLLCAMTARLGADDVTIFGRHDDKMAIVARAGVSTAFSAEIEAGQHSTFDIVIEASGSESGFATALDLVRPRGTIVLKSTFHGTPQWEASRVVVDEITIVGSRCGRFEPALQLLADGKLNISGMISDEFPLSDAVAAMERAEAKGVIKVLLRP